MSLRPYATNGFPFEWFYWILGQYRFFSSSWEYWFAGRSPKFIHLFLGGQSYSYTEGCGLGSWMPIFLFRVGSVFIGGKLNIAWITSTYIHYEIYFFSTLSSRPYKYIHALIKKCSVISLNWRRLWSCKHFMLKFNLHKYWALIVQCLAVQLFKREA